MPVTQEQENSLWWNRPVVFWHENQVALTFHSGIDRSGGVENVIASLKLNDLNQIGRAHV
jgi:hypothetical protein